MTESIKKLQRIVYYVLIALLILMVFFSFQAIQNKGQDGFDKCIAWKCEKSQEFCQKFREINNCCLGAGGVVAQQGNGVTCVFK